MREDYKQMKGNQSRIPLARLAPEIWKHQLFSKLLLAPLFAAFTLSGVTSGDFPFRAWQGAVILTLLLLAVALCVSVDLNVKILYAGNVTDGVSESIFVTMKKAVAAPLKFFRPEGFGVMLYITLMTPILCVGLGVSAAEGLGALTFEAKKAPLYHLVYIVLTLMYAVLGISHIFCLHGVLLDGLSVRESLRRSREIMRKRWRHFLGKHIAYALSGFAFFLLSSVFLFVTPLSLGAQLFPVNTARSLMILTLFLNAALFAACALLLTPCYFIGVTRLYREYSLGVPVVIPERKVKKYSLFMAIALLYLLEIAALSSQTSRNFDGVFPPQTATRIVAHRGGGKRNAENTLSGLETAIALGAYGSEVDVQRTIDGHYVLNHDATFERFTGDTRMLKEMTLEEIQALPYPVPTLEQTLDEAKGRILLFIELKGDTADRHMCNDVVRMIQERDMGNQTVLLSFKKNLISYIETRWPEVRTGYLDFSVTADAEKLPCDYWGIEEEGVTPETVRAAHELGKKLLVWTPNSAQAQERLFLSGADAIITDEVKRAKEIRATLNRDNDFGPVLAAFR